MSSQTIVVIAVAVFMGWFAIGMIYNLRRGDRLLKWMQAGLPIIGQRTSFRWLGSSVADMSIARAKRPFQRLDTLLVLKPRDVFWMRIIAAFQGRDDLIIFRAYLSTPPLLDLELANPRAWTGRTVIRQLTRRGWESADYHGMQLLAPKGLLGLATTTIDHLGAARDALAPRFVRFGLRKSAPNMEIHVPFPDPGASDSKLYFEALAALGRAVGERY
ncbi:MAG TPA: hypothetical protein VIU38_05960 [Anaerolineales bacterium]